MSFLHKPRHVWFRKALFQIHLWTGLIFGLYMLVIGTTGAVLVFQDELSPSPKFKVSVERAPMLDISSIATHIQMVYPKAQLEGISSPTSTIPFYSALLKGSDGRFFTLYAQPSTGLTEQAHEPRWIGVIGNLHFSLLAGKHGRVLNGIGAGLLLLLCISGLVIWWPGIELWRRSVTVNFQGSWKRINLDLHSAIGFWSLALLSMWAISGIYFIWPQQVEVVVNRISATSSAFPPKVVMPPRTKGPQPPLETVIRRAELAASQSRVAGVDFPNSDTDALVVYVPRGDMGDFTRMDCFYFDPSTGRQLALWHRGVNLTLGSKFIFWLSPLHLGKQWGLPVKIIWALCGLGLPLLFLTGALMFWNRTLSKKWRSIRKLSTIRSNMPEARLLAMQATASTKTNQDVKGAIHVEADQTR